MAVPDSQGKGRFVGRALNQNMQCCHLANTNKELGGRGCLHTDMYNIVHVSDCTQECQWSTWSAIRSRKSGTHRKTTRLRWTWRQSATWPPYCESSSLITCNWRLQSRAVRLHCSVKRGVMLKRRYDEIIKAMTSFVLSKVNVVWRFVFIQDWLRCSFLLIVSVKATYSSHFTADSTQGRHGLKMFGDGGGKVTA